MSIGQLLWFLTVGWWAAPLWLLGALLMFWNPFGRIMLYQVPGVASGAIIGLGD